MANSPGAQELMTFASGPALVKWPQHLQQEHGDCQRKFGLISFSTTPPPQLLPLFIAAASPPPFPIALSLFPFPSHFALKFVNLSGFPLCSSFFCFSHTFSRRSRDTHNSRVARTQSRRQGKRQSSPLLFNHRLSSSATCATPEQ